jgi:hypothetical protein
VDAAKAAAKADLDAHQKQRLSDCNALTAAAELRLNEAVHICLERVLK